MEARSHINHNADLGLLQQHLLRLAESVDRALVGAIWTLAHHDLDEARRVVDAGIVIGELRHEVEDSAIQLLAFKPHIPYDVRTISAIMFVAAELERIGDYAAGIAAVMLRQTNLPPLSTPSALGQMAHRAREMLQSAIRAMIKRDAEAAARLNQSDDVIDALYQRVVQDVLLVMRAQPQITEWATYLLWIGHNLERIADRAVNIAERAAFASGASLPRRQRAEALSQVANQ
jgi:phosphate transport system protein